ncbi:MAG: histidine kinase [Desulfatiglandales bacterium]|jgi:sensor histidine kinase YesM|nr:histidine kinase [Desulfatiglandales bacterium]
MGSDLKKGKSMLADLIHYLRTIFSKSRGDLVTMAQEMEMVRAYLNIFKIKMGDRLRYAIDIQDA